MNQGNPDEEFEERLRQVRAQTADTLSSPTEQKLDQLDEDLRTMLAKALVDSQRNAVKSTRDALDRAAHEAFRRGDGPRERWTLADWGHAWAGLKLLAEAVLRSEPGSNVGELLAFVRADDKRPGYLLAFLNETGDPVPRRLSEIAARVGETGSTRSEGPSEDDARGSTNDDDTQPKLNAVFNRLQTLTAYRLVKRAGPSAGLYELTRWGYKTARALQAEDLEKAVSSIADRSVLSFLACFGDAATATTPLEGAAIREKLRSEPRAEQPDRLSEQLVFVLGSPPIRRVKLRSDPRVEQPDRLSEPLAFALTYPLICRVDSHEDRYELTASGRKIRVELSQLLARIRQDDDLEQAVSSIVDYGVLRFLAWFRDATTAAAPLGAATIHEKLRPVLRVEQFDRSSEQLLSLALRFRLIRRVDSHEDRYELTALGSKIAVEVRDLRARTLSGDATFGSIGPSCTLAGDYDGRERQRDTAAPFAHALRRSSPQTEVYH